MNARTAPQIFLSVMRPGSSGPERVDLGTRLKSIEYTEDEKKADKLTLKLDNYDLTEFERPSWRKGNIIHVQWGYPGDMAPERECIIQTVKGSVELHIEANGKEAVMNRKPKGRHFPQMTRAQVVKQILGEYSLAFLDANIEDDGIVYEQITQAGVTDYVFLRDVARRARKEFFLDFDGAHYHTRRTGQRPLREFIYFTDSQQGDIIGWSIDNDISAGKPGAVQLQGRNPDTKEDIDVTAGNASTQRDGDAPILEAIDETDGTAQNVANVASRHVGHTTEPTADAAMAKASGLYTQSQLAAVQITLHCWGDANVVAKSTIVVKGLGPVMSGTYYVTSATHDVGSGYTMKLKCKREGHGKAGGIAGTTPSDAKQNNLPPPPDGDTLQPFTVISQVDGTAGEGFRDTRGRGGS